MKDLKKLKLSIPTLDSSECKTLMGGDIYTEGAQDNWDYNWEQIFDQLGIKHPLSTSKSQVTHNPEVL